MKSEQPRRERRALTTATQDPNLRPLGPTDRAAITGPEVGSHPSAHRPDLGENLNCEASKTLCRRWASERRAHRISSLVSDSRPVGARAGRHPRPDAPGDPPNAGGQRSASRAGALPDRSALGGQRGGGVRAARAPATPLEHLRPGGDPPARRERPARGRLHAPRRLPGRGPGGSPGHAWVTS